MFPLAIILAVHYLIINNSTALNMTSFPGLIRYENSDLNGLLGLGFVVALFVIIMASLSYLIDFINGVMIAGFVATGISLLLSLPGIAVIAQNYVYIFFAITAVAILINVFRGVASTW